MKKLFFIAIVALFSFSATAQNFNVGLSVGLPTGDVSDSYSLTIGIDASYLWEVSGDFSAGISAGYSHFMGDEINIPGGGSFDIDDASFLPVSAAGRLNISDDFVFGADLGYAVGLSPDGNDGGFYYRPLLGYNVGENTQITASYRGVSVDGSTVASINVGVNFGL